MNHSMTVPPRAALAKALLVAGLCALLTACATLGGLVGAARVPVLSGAVTVAAPSGYCVGPAQVKEAQDTAVALIGRCLSTGLVMPAVISVSVGRSGSAGVMIAGPEAVAAFFGRPEGRQLLARSGRAKDLKVIETRVRDGALLMHLDDAGVGSYWRAILGLKGRLITISAQGTGGVVLPDPASLSAVEGTLAAMRAANPAPTPKDPTLLEPAG